MTTDIQEQAAAPDENKIIAERRAKLATLREQGIAFPNDFRRADFAGDLQDEFIDADTWTGEALEASGRRVAIAILSDQPPGTTSYAALEGITRRLLAKPPRPRSWPYP